MVVEDEQSLLGLQRSQADITQPLLQLASDARPRSHWREKYPQVSLPENPQLGVWVDNPHLPLAINVNSQRSGLAIQTRTNFQATEHELSSKVAEQELEVCRCPGNQR